MLGASTEQLGLFNEKGAPIWKVSLVRGRALKPRNPDISHCVTTDQPVRSVGITNWTFSETISVRASRCSCSPPSSC